MSNTTCPTCGGRGSVSNALTGSAEKCPLCQGTTKVSRGLTDQLFYYPISPPQLTANQLAVLATVTIDNDADFEWRWIIASSTGLYSVELQDNYAASPLMPSAINGENLAGTAQLPFVLPKPYPLYRTTTMKAKFNDRSGANNTIQFILAGYKLDKLPPGPSAT
jgi:hypothetical protein